MSNIDVFNKYVNDFDLNNKDIKGKYTHSIRVMEISKLLAKYLNLNKEDIDIATNIGLLHDIGRFNQLQKYSSYDDFNTIDHAEYGANLLFKNKLIEQFNIDSKDYNLIEKAIRNHNKYSIDDNLDDRETLFSKIIRDADKMDILNRICNLKDLDCSSDKNNEISEKVKQDFFDKKLILKQKKNNKNDSIVLNLSFVFDFNYKFSFIYIKENNIIGKFKELINDSRLDEYFDFINKYIDERID